MLPSSALCHVDKNCHNVLHISTNLGNFISYDSHLSANCCLHHQPTHASTIFLLSGRWTLATSVEVYDDATTFMLDTTSNNNAWSAVDHSLFGAAVDDVATCERGGLQQLPCFSMHDASATTPAPPQPPQMPTSLSGDKPVEMRLSDKLLVDDVAAASVRMTSAAPTPPSPTLATVEWLSVLFHRSLQGPTDVSEPLVDDDHIHQQTIDVSNF